MKNCVTGASGARLRLIVSMVLFGTIGIFVRHIPLSSSIIALVRGCVGMVFLLAVTCVKKQKISWNAVKANLLWLVLSGAFLGFNWILLFESYRYTSVAVSTLCYYMAPILVILASPLFLKEKLTARKLLCVLLALIGAVCISGILGTGIQIGSEVRGILLGLGAAVLYAGIMLLNKQVKGISAYDKTIVQLGISALVLLPYCLATVNPGEAVSSVSPSVLGLLLLVGIVHTGLTYYLYFGSMEYVSGQSVAIISYVDPVVAILVSVTLLREPMGLAEAAGALLILGAAVLSELPEKKKGVHHD